MFEPEFPISRRTAFRQAAGLFLITGALGRSQSVDAFWLDDPAQSDARFGPLKDLDAYFPFTPPDNQEDWAARAEELRRQILLAAGLWPMPTRPELVPVIHGKVDRDGYTVERVYVETFPDLYLTGSLYRPDNDVSKRPAVLCPHGHWNDGRFYDHGEEKVQKEIELEAERFAIGGRYPLQARCVQLARMGCVVFLYDMLGYADSAPITMEVAHKFAKQRPELSSPERWGLFSAQAELRLQNVLGLQLYNSIRALDMISSLPDVDTNRIAVTGASGGGTQTFLLAAVDDRPAAAFPAVMVSTAMQGGCTCENASYLRVRTGNVEIAALIAPRPLGLTGANDWTKEIETKGLPELKRHYERMGAGDAVEGKYFSFEHNYNAQARLLMYHFMNRHLNLGASEPIEEHDYVPLSREEATVWDTGHPKPPCDDDAEVRLLQALDADSRARLDELTPRDQAGLAAFRKVVGQAFQTMVGRNLPEAGDVEYQKEEEQDRGDYLETTAQLFLKSQEERVPVIFLHPTDWNGRVVLWIDPAGKAGLLQEDATPIPAVRRLIDSKIAVCGVDLHQQGSAVLEGHDSSRIRTVSNPREFLGYTVGYNHPLFAQRVHDILTLLSFVRHHDFSPSRVDLVAPGGAAKWGAAAAAILPTEALNSLALGTDGFRFRQIIEILDPDLWPGALKYGDLPSLLGLCAPRPLWLAGEETTPELTAACYQASGQPDRLACAGLPADEAEAATTWLLENS